MTPSLTTPSLGRYVRLARVQLRRLRRHAPSGLMPALIGLGLLGGGAYAVAAAVVTLGPDPAQLPVHEVRMEVQALPQAEPAQIEPTSFSLYRSDAMRSKDTPDTLLARLGFDDEQAVAFLRSHRLVHRHLLGRTGRLLTVEANAERRLLKLVARWSPSDDGTFQRLVIERQMDYDAAKQGNKRDGIFDARLEIAPLTASLRMAGGVIDSSLFASTDAAGIPTSVAVQLAELFSGDIDFNSDLRPGDRYAVVYEVLEGDGEPLRPGRVLSAEFVNDGKTHRAVWFTEPPSSESTTDSNADTAVHSAAAIMPSRSIKGRSGYYDFEGRSMKRLYLASPLAFSRVTSGFRMRLHPIHKTWTAHLGVDYAAPIGTPVRSVGDGVVSFAGEQGGYGNVVFIRHKNGHQTVYAHLSRILVKRGQSVAQGQTIAASGATGWATGPHLHYEFRINGKHQNPLLVARRNESSAPVAPHARPAFERVVAEAGTQLAAAQTLLAASR